jgi:glycosyltransferase involved in cell wall biosynthesis
MVAEVSVILSSFNGARYLREQLDSLLGQSYPNLLIQVRDDGSSDGTRAILQDYAAQHANIRVDFGERLGIASSFFQLLEHAADGSEYFAFCDQDDVWYPDKIERAVSRLSALKPGIPALYCSRLEYVDADLNHLRFSRIPGRGLSFGSALVENSATGCTVVMNRAARDLIVRAPPGHCIMHDWWCYLVVAAFGVVIYDESPGLKYRLHAGNDTGAAVSFVDDFARRARRFWTNRHDSFRIHAQARAFAQLYADRLATDKRRLLDRFLASKRSGVDRIRFALSPGLHRQTRLDDAILRVLIVLGWY